MAFAWFTVVESFRLGDRSKHENDSEIVDWKTFAGAFICNVKIQAAEETYVNVDAFPLLYEFMNSTFCLREPKEISVVVGEGWCISGTPNDGSVNLRIDWDDQAALVQRRMSLSEVSLFISLKISEIVSSLEKIDVDVEYYLSRFPPHLYTRGLSS